MGVSPPTIGVSVGGNRLAQITVVGGFVGRYSILRGVSSPFFGRLDRIRERKYAKMYHSRRVD